MAPRMATSSLWRPAWLGSKRRQASSQSRSRQRRGSRSATVEQLEGRALLAVSASVVGSELLINLSEANDAAALQIEGGNYAIRSGTQSLGSFSAAGINAIRVTGQTALANQSLFVKPGGVLAASLIVNSGIESTVVGSPIVTSGSVTIESASITLSGDVRSSGPQTYAGLVRVAADIVLDAGASAIRFGGEIRSTVGQRASLMEDIGAPYQVALSPDGRTLYASDAVSNFVYFIDLAEEELDTIDLGKSVGQVLLSPNGQRLYVANNFDNSISVIDTTTRLLVATINVIGTPEGMAISADGNTLYAANYSENVVAVINTATARLTSTIPVSRSPTAVAVAADGRLWVTSEALNRVSVLTVSPTTVVHQIDVGRGPADIVLSPDGSRAYVANNFDNSVTVINTGSGAVVATVGVGSGPTKLAVAPDGRLVYVVNGFSDSVSVIDAATLTLATTVPVGSLPAGIALSADGRTVYVANLSSLTELGNDARSLTVRTTDFAHFTAPENTIDPLRALIIQAKRRIESAGTVSLWAGGAGNLRANDAQVTAGGSPVNYQSYRSWGWTARAAERIGGVNTIAWENEAGTLHFWRLTDGWAQTAADSMLVRGTPEFAQAEVDFGLDFDGDGVIGRGLTVIENVGAVTLGYDSAGNLLANDADISSFGAPVSYQTYLSWGWAARAAETIRGVNTIVWENTQSGNLQLWELSSSWAHQTSRGDIARGTAAYNAAEAAFGIDFNGDGVIAPATTIIESSGDTTLEYDGDGNLRANGILITSLGGLVNYDRYLSWGWTARAAETSGGTRTLVWQNGAGELQFWRLSDGWDHVKSEGNFAAGSPQYDTAEAEFGVDFNGDSKITIESAGSVALWYDASGNLRANNTPITWAGGTAVNYGLFQSWGWDAYAAEPVPESGNTIVWRNRETGGLHYWRLTAGWAQQSGSGDDRPGSQGYNQAERTFQTDFDRNGIVGQSFGGEPVVIENRGSVTLLRDGGGNLMVSNQSVVSANGPVGYFTFLSWGWTALAADVVGGVNTIAWQNAAGELHLWELSSDWVHVRSRGNYAPGTLEFEAARQALQLDI